MSLRNIDLNLLVVLEALLEECHITRTAQRLNMSQPAVSRALGRLRQQFDDPLLLRSNEGYQLTPVARSLRLKLDTLMTGVEAFYDSGCYNPSSAEIEITIVTMDDCLSLFLPAIYKRLQQQAPGIKLKLGCQWGSTLESLEEGKADFLIEAVPDLGSSFHSVPLYSSPWVAVMSADHPLALKKLSVKQYAACKHGMVSVTGTGPSLIDKILERQGYQRVVDLRIPHFVAIPNLLLGTDLVFTIPKALADQYAQQSDIVCKPLPIKVPPLRYSLAWHHRNHRDQLHTWVRGQIMEACSDL
ncbi:LysR family transcriptional regulator [Pseudoteredinibacter isoporae]|uniref:DNA-binding transcriptional LysR family regulator n=1 Tax=Pseudoteredinibacter isoporae TaxID=570281 RepID=A0A7X0JSH1_9GAMM|nr:LysR family transcriptional regulator [Pseudoteredinibacter isoporae]MBB6521472.1 DNA-binding transcriptional LysR family regulator [Pseudoteredinibacter isoporae]NHO87026.1 LysR family transcriptional regulator [Pseudoteredinibacter isoporae]NIB24521.1 LysR family transcriptional regulator [Pseudoteredinibacter isoporae]